MRLLPLPPSAPVLMESMRAVGYDAATAVADIIDNSITAAAKHVWILFEPDQASAVAILDDGSGMSAAELETAMRHGSQCPTDSRDPDDLGRFGLGMKTASLSQCRRLTVLSKKAGALSGMVWDLDVVAQAGGWQVGVLEEVELCQVPHAARLGGLESGTLVVWEKLDRLAEGDCGKGRVLADQMGKVSGHLSMVFHRFLSTRDRLAILVNDTPVTPVDPFLEQLGSNPGPPESFTIDGHEIRLRAYTLPHISRLTRPQVDASGGIEGLRKQQGFYVYRGDRLIIWGTWFKLHRQEELSKLTRVKVDIPNALDHLWGLDIKKASASPPAVIRDRLRSLLPRLVEGSRKAHDWRGRRSEPDGPTPLWHRIEDRDGVRYHVNLEHPLLAAFQDRLGEEAAREHVRLLEAIADTLPIELIHNDRSNDLLGAKRGKATAEEEDRLEALAIDLLAAAQGLPEVRARMLEGLGGIEPFCHHPSLVEKLKRRLG